MAENYISQYHTWVTGNVITADRLNGNIQNIIDGLSGGSKTVNLGKLLINTVECINSSREATFTKVTVGNNVIDDGKNANIEFTKTIISTGTTIQTIGIGNNSGAIIEMYGAGLIGSDMSSYFGRWSVFRTTGATTIRMIDDEIRDGTEEGYLSLEQSGNAILMKGYTSGSTAWSISGHFRIISSGTVTIS